MNGFDKGILEILNRFAQRSWTFDMVATVFEHTNLLKGGIIAAILFGLWFMSGKEETIEKNRRAILTTFAGTFMAMLLVQILHAVVPFRARPLYNPGLHLVRPFGLSKDILAYLTSFPSDHATLLVGLAAGIFYVSRPLGFVSIGYVLLFILFPRMYLGLHYPTDILVGGLAGAACVVMMNIPKIRKIVTDPLIAWSERRPGWFYGLFFLVTYQTAVLFEDVRDLASFILRVSAALIHRIY